MWGFTLRGSWRSNITAIFWPQCYGRHVVSFLFSRAAQPEVQRPLCWMLAFFIASYQHLLRTSTHQGPKPPSAWCGFPYHTSSPTVWNPLAGTQFLNCRLDCVQRLHDRPLDLWNRMFNRHEAEITAMQFRGHSLPVRQSMRVSWDIFTSSHFISQFPPMRFPLITAIRMCHFLPVHHLEWHFWPGQKVKI